MITLRTLAIPIAGAAITVCGTVTDGTIGRAAHLLQRRLREPSTHWSQPTYGYYNDPHYDTY